MRSLLHGEAEKVGYFALSEERRVCNVLAEVPAAVGTTFSKWRALPSTTESVRSVLQDRIDLMAKRVEPHTGDVRFLILRRLATRPSERNELLKTASNRDARGEVQAKDNH